MSHKLEMLHLTLDYDSELCLVISFFLPFSSSLHISYQIDFSTTYAQHCFCSRLHLDFLELYIKGDCSSLRIKKSFIVQ